MKKRIEVLIVILVIVIIFVAGCFVYDDNKRLIARTTGLRIGEGIEIVDMDKHGFPFRRSGYEAKISIPHDHPEIVTDAIYEIYQQNGAFMNYAEYYAMTKDVFDSVNIRPVVENGTNVWALGVEHADKENVFFLVVSQDSENAYLYIYYSRY